MIKRVSNQKTVAVWDIDGFKTKLHYAVANVDVVENTLLEYKQILQDFSYKKNHELLHKVCEILSTIPFIDIGYGAYREDFLRMFRYFSECYVPLSHIIEKPNNTALTPSLVFQHMLGPEFKGKSVYRYRTDTTVICLRELEEILKDEFKKYWVLAIEQAIDAGENLCRITQSIGKLKVAEYCAGILDTVEPYLKINAAQYTVRRIMISKKTFQLDMFGSGIRAAECNKAFNDMLEKVVYSELDLQKQKFVAENRLQLNVQSDLWVLYKMHGPTLHRCTMDFTIIHCPSMRMEVKHYMKYRNMEVPRINDGFIYPLAEAVNFLTNHNPNIMFFSDIDDVDAQSLHIGLESMQKSNGKNLALSYVIRAFAVCRAVCEYLMGDARDERIRSPRPYQNPFAKYVFVNALDYCQNTPVIPEDVIERIEAHLPELEWIDQLLFKIFSDTGMRLKEVLFLQADCLEKSRYSGCVTLKYKPYKILAARRRSRLSDYHRILIHSALADEIKKLCENTASLRAKYEQPYIFMRMIGRVKAGMIGIPRFIIRLNNLIKKHNICDESGVLWHFTSRQYRKTIAVTLIENGATVEELAYWLGHLDRSTTVRYYAEVRKAKLAEMNTEFFKKKFDILLSPEQLEGFSEEERRLLYIDFRLEQRKVEFGYCLKKIADGGCDNRNSLYNCINCKNLCTGQKYLSHWQELLQQQEFIIAELLGVYRENNITGYLDFKEYKHEMFLLEGYQNIVKAIMGGKNE